MHITLASLVYKTRSTKYGFKVTVMITRIWYQSHFSRGLCSLFCLFLLLGPLARCLYIHILASITSYQWYPPPCPTFRSSPSEGGAGSSLTTWHAAGEGCVWLPRTPSVPPPSSSPTSSCSHPCRNTASPGRGLLILWPSSCLIPTVLMMSCEPWRDSWPTTLLPS